VELPSLNAIITQANETFVATLKDIIGDIPLPPGVKLPDLKLPPLPNVRQTLNSHLFRLQAAHTTTPAVIACDSLQ
jgi:hypothetical protein